jgi:hypothetical protein
MGMFDDVPMEPKSGANFADAISSIESGGNYRALGPQTGKGRALGKYQVMDFNVGPWSEKVLGRRLTPEQFLADDKAQDQIFEGVFGNYVKKYGPEGAAKAWFAGERGMNNPNAKDMLGTTVASYAEKFNKRAGNMSASAQSKTPERGGGLFDDVPMEKSGGKFDDVPLIYGPEVPDMGRGRAFVQGAKQGASFNFNDTLAGVMDAGRIPTWSRSSMGNPIGMLAGSLYGAANVLRDPKAAAARYQTGRDVERAKDETAGIQYPGTALAGNVAGGLATAPLIPAKALQAATMGGRALKTAGVGALYGGVSGAGTGKNLEEGATNAATGAAIGGVIGGVASPVVEGVVNAATNAARSRATQAAIPKAQELVDSYLAAKNSPVVADVEIKPRALASEVRKWATELEKSWVTPKLAPDTYEILGQMAAPRGPLTMANVDEARRQLGEIAGKGGTDSAAAMHVKRALDDWMLKGVKQADVIRGDVTKAQKIMQAGRGDYSKAKLAEALDTRIAEGEIQAGGQHSGMNVQNILRQKVGSYLKSDDSNGLSAMERKAAEQFASGGAGGEKFLRFAGKWLGGGGGLGSMATTAGAVAYAGPVGLAAPAAGLGLTFLSNAISRSEAQKLSELIRANSPLGKQLQSSIAAWTKYATAAHQKPMTPRIQAMLTIQSRNLSNNLRDAGIIASPQDIMRSVLTHRPVAAEGEQGESGQGRQQ